jgi:hypothetical protein
MIGEHRQGLPLWRTTRWREMFRETMRELDEGPTFAGLCRESLSLLRAIEENHGRH